MRTESLRSAAETGEWRTSSRSYLHAITGDVHPATLKSGSIAESCRGAHVSGGLSHRRPTTIVDQVPPESIRAAARDIACRAFDVHVLAIGTCAIN